MSETEALRKLSATMNALAMALHRLRMCGEEPNGRITERKVGNILPVHAVGKREVSMRA